MMMMMMMSLFDFLINKILALALGSGVTFFSTGQKILFSSPDFAVVFSLMKFISWYIRTIFMPLVFVLYCAGFIGGPFILLTIGSCS